MTASPRRYLKAPLHAAVILAVTCLEVMAAAVMVVGLAGAYGLGLVFVLPWGIACARVVANLGRSLSGAWSGTPIPDPYLPAPGPARPGPDGRYHAVGISFRTRVVPEFLERCERLVRDRATWRDALWLLVDPIVGAGIALQPLLLVLCGGFGLTMPLLGIPGGWDYLGVPLGLGMLVLGVWIGPRMLDLHAAWTRSLLAPTKMSVLARKLLEVDEKRAAATDWQAAEVRRIERDLHDGPQARLVALGMTVSAAEELVDDDPAAAKALLRQAQESSSAVLQELRGLVRGIRPPVLAERGLVDAVRALALDSVLQVEVSADMPEPVSEPVQATAYFAVAEALANAAKHARAQRVEIDLWQRNGTLRVTVADDGRGGADPARGSGLRGIERRLGPSNGVLALSSPAGGPTTVTIELPYDATSQEVTDAGVAVGRAVAGGCGTGGMTRRQLWEMAVASVVVPIALFPQGIVAAVQLLFTPDNRSWFLALYMPEALQWPTAAAMIAFGLAGLPLLVRRQRAFHKSSFAGAE
ncbi:sensor histidine kinase [Streptomyces sp. A7024]|uniref:histidine kinase n=1 Tax=Streptomyces coryli TaxID=1128680 RepID=A0A6G4UBF1_9ACTN|nr:histidine kinase [Streptomyces coryli]NGN69504.1 sensor histidine kinase [Streptomyces coryli]